MKYAIFESDGFEVFAPVVDINFFTVTVRIGRGCLKILRRDFVKIINSDIRLFKICSCCMQNLTLNNIRILGLGKTYCGLVMYDCVKCGSSGGIKPESLPKGFYCYRDDSQSTPEYQRKIGMRI